MSRAITVWLILALVSAAAPAGAQQPMVITPVPLAEPTARPAPPARPPVAAPPPVEARRSPEAARAEPKPARTEAPRAEAPRAEASRTEVRRTEAPRRQVRAVTLTSEAREAHRTPVKPYPGLFSWDDHR